MDKIYCKDINRQIHYTKGRLQIIINTLHSIFNEPFNNFIIMKNTHKSIEELATDINNSVRKIVLYFLLLVPVLFIIILLFSGGSLIPHELANETSNKVVNNPSIASKDGDVIFVCSILAVIGIYVVITLLISIIFNIVTFICLWKFVNKNTRIISIF